MNDLKCYIVTCIDNAGNLHEVDVVTSDSFAARHCAEYFLYDGRLIVAKAIKVVENT